MGELVVDETVTLTLRPGDRGGWLLICEYSGVGLTRNLITNHLLVSGNNRRPDILAYLKETLIRIPCRFEFKTEGLPAEPLNWQLHAG